MDMPLLRDVEDKVKILRNDKAQLHEDMLVFCRCSNDPGAQELKHRLDVIAAGWEALSTDIDKLQFMYDTSREKRIFTI